MGFMLDGVIGAWDLQCFVYVVTLWTLHLELGGGGVQGVVVFWSGFMSVL